MYQVGMPQHWDRKLNIKVGSADGSAVVAVLKIQNTILRSACKNTNAAWDALFNKNLPVS